MQKILWSPGSYDSNLVSSDNNNNSNFNKQKKILPNSKTKAKFEKGKLSQAIAFIHGYDIYYKPKIHSDLVVRVTTNGELFLLTIFDEFENKIEFHFHSQFELNLQRIELLIVIYNT